jgi:hypothetical protein
MAAVNAFPVVCSSVAGDAGEGQGDEECDWTSTAPPGGRMGRDDRRRRAGGSQAGWR